MLFIVSAAALAVDTGRIEFRRRFLQSTTDLVSLDAVRAVGDRYDATFVGGALAMAAQFAEQAAKDRNGFDYDDTAHGASMTVEIGTVDWNTNAFTSLASCTLPGGSCSSTAAQDALANAVRVTTGSRVDHAFLPGSSAMDAAAVGGNDAQAGIGVGSSLTKFNSSTSPLNTILGTMGGVNLTAGSYDSLLGADVALGDVWANLGLGSADEVFNGEVSARDAADAMITALNNDGSPSSVAAATALGSTTGTLSTTATFSFADLMDANVGSPNEVAGTRVNVLQLFTMMVSAANGNNLVTADLPVTVPGVAKVTMNMGLIEPPKIAVGPARQDALGAWKTKAETAQVRMMLNLELSNTLTVAGQAMTVNLPIYVDAGGATGELRSIDCVTPFDSSPVGVHVATSASSGYVGQVSNASLTGGSVVVLPATVVDKPGLLTATATASYTVAAQQSDLTFTGPFDQPPAPSTVTPKTRPPQTVGAASPSLDELTTNLNVTVVPAAGAGLLVNAVLVAAQIKGMLTPVIQALDTSLLDKLAGMPLGFTFGGADVTNTSLNCHLRRLAG
jgi:uncharacterized membrane protein